MSNNFGSAEERSMLHSFLKEAKEKRPFATEVELGLLGLKAFRQWRGFRAYDMAPGQSSEGSFLFSHGAKQSMSNPSVSSGSRPAKKQHVSESPADMQAKYQNNMLNNHDKERLQAEAEQAWLEAESEAQQIGERDRQQVERALLAADIKAKKEAATEKQRAKETAGQTPYEKLFAQYKAAYPRLYDDEIGMQIQEDLRAGRNEPDLSGKTRYVLFFCVIYLFNVKDERDGSDSELPVAADGNAYIKPLYRLAFPNMSNEELEALIATHNDDRLAKQKLTNVEAKQIDRRWRAAQWDQQRQTGIKNVAFGIEHKPLAYGEHEKRQEHETIYQAKLSELREQNPNMDEHELA